jgi:hypothetical protein
MIALDNHKLEIERKKTAEFNKIIQEKNRRYFLILKEKEKKFRARVEPILISKGWYSFVKEISLQAGSRSSSTMKGKAVGGGVGAFGIGVGGASIDGDVHTNTINSIQIQRKVCWSHIKVSGNCLSLQEALNIEKLK